MRVWDVSPGYLNRQSLLGEHREIHGLLVVIGERRRGYSRHPETLRWNGHLGALRRRHDGVVAEMALRGYEHHSPAGRAAGDWPDTYIDRPGRQFEILKVKYATREPGRIPLPRSVQELWAQHKYSVMARSQAAYRAIGKRVAGLRRGTPLDALAEELVALLRQPVSDGDGRNVIQHMAGYVTAANQELKEIARAARAESVDYLLHSTALSDLA
jgi:hypothetical protein